jgi:hypothetical protein
MKKLMIAALAVASITAFAANTCAPDDPVVTEPTLVYSFKANVKTTKGLSYVNSYDAGSVCAPDPQTDKSVIRVPDTTALAGWIYDCTATCETIANGSIVVWDTKRKAQLDEAAMEKILLQVIGKKQADAEFAFKLTGTFKYDDVRQQALTEVIFAALGKFSVAKGFYTSFTGNFAGTAAASYDLTTKKNVNCDPSQVWLCTDLLTLVEADTVYYGTWSAKYNASASKKYARNGYLNVPAYVTYQ